MKQQALKDNVLYHRKLKGYTQEELGELYLLKRNKAESKKYFSEAYQILSQDQWLQKNEAERLKRIKKLSL